MDEEASEDSGKVQDGDEELVIKTTTRDMNARLSLLLVRKYGTTKYSPPQHAERMAREKAISVALICQFRCSTLLLENSNDSDFIQER